MNNIRRAITLFSVGATTGVDSRWL